MFTNCTCPMRRGFRRSRMSFESNIHGQGFHPGCLVISITHCIGWINMWKWNYCLDAIVFSGLKNKMIFWLSMSPILRSHVSSRNKEGGCFQNLNAGHQNWSARTFSIDNSSCDCEKWSQANEIDNFHETTGLRLKEIRLDSVCDWRRDARVLHFQTTGKDLIARRLQAAEEADGGDSLVWPFRSVTHWFFPVSLRGAFFAAGGKCTSSIISQLHFW
jgi:hypothetical protein